MKKITLKENEYHFFLKQAFWEGFYTGKDFDTKFLPEERIALLRMKSDYETEMAKRIKSVIVK